MPAIAEIRSTVASKPDPRGSDLPTCPVCADSMESAVQRMEVSIRLFLAGAVGPPDRLHDAPKGKRRTR